MILKIIPFALLVGLGLQGCIDHPVLPLEAYLYMPHQAFLSEGITSKYYARYDRGSNYEVERQIEYRTWQLTEDSLVVEQIFSPAFAKQRSRTSILNATGLKIMADTFFYRSDTTITDIISPWQFTWRDSTAQLEVISATSYITRQQLSNRDTMWEGKPARVLNYELTIRDSNEVLISQRRIQELFSPDVGLAWLEVRDSAFTYTLTLDRQLSAQQVSDFKASVPKRVAFIDPENTLIESPDFKTCSDIDRIADYYNATPDAGYKGGKYAIQQDLVSKLDLSELQGESGYLTFRFVITCKGEVGRFTTDEADLDYNPKSFPLAPKRQIAQQIQQLVGWRFAVLSDEPRDSYAYLTLKLQDGELIDVLP